MCGLRVSDEQHGRLVRDRPAADGRPPGRGRGDGVGGVHRAHGGDPAGRRRARGAGPQEPCLRRVLRAEWKSNFGRPTPATRFPHRFYGACWASSASVEASGAWTPFALCVVAYCALVPGALADVFQQRAQAAIHAAEASIVLSSEPIWAALLAAPVLGEGLTARVGGGGALIFAGAALAASGSDSGSDEAAAFLEAAFADVQV